MVLSALRIHTVCPYLWGQVSLVTANRVDDDEEADPYRVMGEVMKGSDYSVKIPAAAPSRCIRTASTMSTGGARAVMGGLKKQLIGRDSKFVSKTDS